MPRVKTKPKDPERHSINVEYAKTQSLRLRMLRLGARLTQERMGALAQVSDGYISKLEKGNVDCMAPDTLQRILAEYMKLEEE